MKYIEELDKAVAPRAPKVMDPVDWEAQWRYETACAEVDRLRIEAAKARADADDFADRLWKIGIVPPFPADDEHVDFAVLIVPKGIIQESTKVALEYRQARGKNTLIAT